MSKYLVTRSVVVDHTDRFTRYVPGQLVELKKVEAGRLNKKASQPFLELVKEKESEEVAE